MFGRDKEKTPPPPSDGYDDSPTASANDYGVAVGVGVGVAETEVPSNIFSEGGKNYRTMGRWDAAFVLITNQVGLGVLSLPGVLQVIGIVPGIIAIIGLGILSTYTAYVLLQFYRRHPHVVNMVDMARVVGGKPLEVIVGIGVFIKLCLTCSSAIVTLSVAFNTMSEHAMCTVGWIAVSAVCCWLLCLPRTFKFVAYIGVPSTISIVAAILVVIISLGVADPKGAPTSGFDKEINVVGNPGFSDGLSSCLQICYAYAGMPSPFFFLRSSQSPLLTQCYPPQATSVSSRTWPR